MHLKFIMSLIFLKINFSSFLLKYRKYAVEKSRNHGITKKKKNAFIRSSHEIRRVRRIYSVHVNKIKSRDRLLVSKENTELLLLNIRVFLCF